MEKISNLFVCLMGMGTVFIGLICIIFICYLMSFVVKSTTGKKKNSDISRLVNTSSDNVPIENKQEIIAAVCAVLAEELGTDARNIRVLSLKKIN